MTAADRNSKYEDMYNNYNLFKYGKVLDRNEGGRTSRTKRALQEDVSNKMGSTYCNFKERSRQNDRVKRSLERMTNERK